MGLDFNRPSSGPAPVLEVAPAQGQEEYQAYDVEADRRQMTQIMVNSPEVDSLASQIEVYNLETIVSFGSGAAEEISKCSDVILNSMNMSQLDDSSAMLTTLAKIMDKFDIEEIKDNPGLFGKLFGNLRRQLDKILAKYHTMGDVRVGDQAVQPEAGGHVPGQRGLLPRAGEVYPGRRAGLPGAGGVHRPAEGGDGVHGGRLHPV